MRRHFHHVTQARVPVQEIPTAHARVELDRYVRDSRGRAVARVSGTTHIETVRTARFMKRKAEEWLQAAGAKQVWSKEPTLGLSGHQHQTYIGNSEEFYPKGRPPVVILHSGTTTSSRGRAGEREKKVAEVRDELLLLYCGNLGYAEARRNVVTRGVPLNSLVGRRVRVGDVECRHPDSRAGHAIEGLVESAVEREHAIERGAKRASVQHGRGLHGDLRWYRSAMAAALPEKAARGPIDLCQPDRKCRMQSAGLSDALP